MSTGITAFAVLAELSAPNVADFCLAMYERMGLLEGIRVVRSSDPEFRRAACSVSDFVADVPYEGEIVRARWKDGKLTLFKGGDVSIELPPTEVGKEQISPSRDTRFLWMQSVIGCTHYVCGKTWQSRDICGWMRHPKCKNCVVRDPIDRSDEAYAG